ncbi:CinA family protein [Nibricoccus sp. IMCC34717]|uniref:CinA family protein n=1 Tax=Nibricoccus sp. IMCC34717 TaxID=3034021 RepID=UPI00384D8E59
MHDAQVFPLPSLAVAESLTCGHLQALLGSVSGASAWFRGGVTAYTLAQKVALLGIDRAHAAEVDCVSERVAREMAAGARRLFSAAVGLSTTGYAEPNARVATPFACWALAWGDDSATEMLSGRFECPGLDRQGVQRAVAAEVHAHWQAWLRSRGLVPPATPPASAQRE